MKQYRIYTHPFILNKLINVNEQLKFLLPLNKEIFYGQKTIKEWGYHNSFDKAYQKILNSVFGIKPNEIIVFCICEYALSNILFINPNKIWYFLYSKDSPNKLKDISTACCVY